MPKIMKKEKPKKATMLTIQNYKCHKVFYITHKTSFESLS